MSIENIIKLHQNSKLNFEPDFNIYSTESNLNNFNNEIKISKQIAELKNNDDAFFNSILSYSIYTDIPNKTNLTKLETLRNEFQDYIGIYINNNFKPLQLNIQNQEYHSTEYNYKTKIQTDVSDYLTLNNLARAGYFLSDNPDGTKTLHLAFRGTDNLAQKFSNFVTTAYPDMRAYYDSFKPLEKAILEFAENPKNNISKLHISGHSLGGAMVQEFFKSSSVNSFIDNNPHIQINGFTYGAPGVNKRYGWGLLTEAFHAIKNKNKFQGFKDLAINSISPIINSNEQSASTFVTFLKTVFTSQLGYPLFFSQSRLNSENTDKIIQYEHSADLIPRLGSLVYEKVGTIHRLFDYASKDIKDSNLLIDDNNPFTPSDNKFVTFLKIGINSIIEKPTHFFKNMFTFKYHDMMRYIINIGNTIDEAIMTNPELAQYTPRYIDFERNQALVVTLPNIHQEHSKEPDSPIESNTTNKLSIDNVIDNVKTQITKMRFEFSDFEKIKANNLSPT